MGIRFIIGEVLGIALVRYFVASSVAKDAVIVHSFYVKMQILKKYNGSRILHYIINHLC
jgi:hypothetical protein